MRSRTAMAIMMSLAGCDDRGAPEPVVDDAQPSYEYPRDLELRFNHVQAKSTHNSYHVEFAGSELVAWSYTHAPLDVQCEEQGVRHFELDLHLEEGVFRVFHLKALDDESNCSLLTDCLARLKSWSDAHRGHHPLTVQLELKDGSQSDYESYFARLHEEILSVWPEHRLITPAFIKGEHPSIAAALVDGWPTLGELRGRVLFTLDDKGERQQAYSHGGKDLAGRLIFPNSDPGDGFAAVAIINDPFDADRISAALAAHMLVRTRADADGVEAQANDTTMQKAALASGAHFVSTDFPVKVDGTEYWLEIQGGTPSRCNPVTRATNCTSNDVENPDELLTPP